MAAKIGMDLVEKVHVLGTPKDLHFFTHNVLRKFGEKPVALCCDHSGFKLKEAIKKLLRQRKIEFIDFGTYVPFACDHYDFLYPALLNIKDGTCDFGMACCQTGQAFNILANKEHGIRSALLYNEDAAEYAIRHNCANFFCLPEFIIDEAILHTILDKLETSTFDGGRHANRIMKAGIE